MFGPKTIYDMGLGMPLSADGNPEYKVGGVTLDWNVFPANADTLLVADPTIAPTVNPSTTGGTIPAGTYNVGYSYKNANGETAISPLTPVVLTSSTSSLTASAPTLPPPSTGTRWYITSNVTPAQANEFLQADVYYNNVSVTVFTNSGTTPVSSNTTGANTVLTTQYSGTTIPNDNVIVPQGLKYVPFGLVLARITASGGAGTVGKYGPYDTGASDGRQTLTRGQCFFANYSTVQNDPHADYCPGVFEGGLIYIARVKVLSSGAFVNTWNSTIAAAFPRIRVVDGL